MRIMIRVPLQAHFRAFQRRFPVIVTGETGLAEARSNCAIQNMVKERAAQSKAERYLLTFLCAPGRAIHHPKEIRLDPTHSGIGEFASKSAVFNRKSSDRGPIGLVDDNRLGIVMGEDVPTFPWPSCNLVQIEFRWKLHAFIDNTSTVGALMSPRGLTCPISAPQAPHPE